MRSKYETNKFYRDRSALKSEGRLSWRPLTQFLQIGLIKLSCFEPNAADRVRAAMTLIEHEWLRTEGKEGRRIYVEISDQVIRVFR